MKLHPSGKIFERHLEPLILRALEAFPAVYVSGPRQAGKSTLSENLVKSGRFKGRYVTFDISTMRFPAWQNPLGYLEEHGSPLVIDEIQRVPQMFDALKVAIDRSRSDALQEGRHVSGLYLLTGSASLAGMPKLAHAMVGRMATKTLLPLSVCEAIGTRSTFLDRCFSGDFSGVQPVDLRLTDAIAMGSFPEMSFVAGHSAKDWYANYVHKITYEDPKHIYNLEKAAYMPMMLISLAMRAGNLVNDASLGREVGLNAVTTKTYRSLLELTFVTNSLMPWTRNIGRRLVKSKKIYFHDTMLLCHLLESSPKELAAAQPNRFGHVLENFVLSELTKANHASSDAISMSYYRTTSGIEVDFVLEKAQKKVAIEVKHSERVSEGDVKGIRDLKKAMGEDLLRGIVLCNAPEVIPYDKGILLVPFAALWQ